MIVPMKRLTLVCLAHHRDRVVRELAEFGAIHLRHRRTPAGEDLEAAREDLARVRRALAQLPARRGAAPSGAPAEAVVESLWALGPLRHELEDRLRWLRAERERIAIFGDFDPAELDRLEREGFFVRLYLIGSREALPEIADAAVEVIAETDQTRAIAVVARSEPDLDRSPVHPPEASLSELDARIHEAASLLRRLDETLAHHAGDREKVAAIVDEALERFELAEARQSMEFESELSLLAMLDGFFPADQEAAVRRLAADCGCAVLIGDADPADEPPTLVRYPRWARPAKAVFDGVGILPGYEGVDASGAVLVFLSIFFAMLVGDAGYGLLFMALTALARWRLGSVSGHVFRLLFIMSGATVVWGAITGTWFGLGDAPGALWGLRLPWLTNPENVMLFCFLLGAVHLSLAHAWRLALVWPRPQSLAQAGWIAMTWVMFFAARSMVLFHDFPDVMLYVFGAGAALIAGFMLPLSQVKREWHQYLMLPLSIISNFVDVVSYIRLFAVGAASFAVATAFNQMALGAGLEGPVAGLVSALILFFGHGLNILLAAMGILVHGVRLNTLEFASHLGLSWSGVPYAPLRRRTRRTSRDEI
jgi:V/A-type H+-transporting ATPase subunit I